MDIHSINITKYCDPEEENKISNLITKLVPESITLEIEKLSAETDGGVFQNDRIAVKAELKKQPDIKFFMEKIKKGLSSEDLNILRESIAGRLDEQGNLYLRLDINKLDKNNLSLAYKDSIHVRIKLAAFPAKKEIFIEKAYEVLS